MPRYGPKASEKVGKAVHEQKRGQLRSSSGKKVTSRRQAIAIGLSEARKEGAKVPPKEESGSGGRKKSGSGKTGSRKKAGSKKAGSKTKSSPKKSAARKSGTKKKTAKKQK